MQNIQLNWRVLDGRNGRKWFSMILKLFMWVLYLNDSTLLGFVIIKSEKKHSHSTVSCRIDRAIENGNCNRCTELELTIHRWAIQTVSIIRRRLWRNESIWTENFRNLRTLYKKWMPTNLGWRYYSRQFWAELERVIMHPLVRVIDKKDCKLKQVFASATVQS